MQFYIQNTEQNHFYVAFALALSSTYYMYEGPSHTRFAPSLLLQRYSPHMHLPPTTPSEAPGGVGGGHMSLILTREATAVTQRWLVCGNERRPKRNQQIHLHCQW
jgi:hypothetical protein